MTETETPTEKLPLTKMGAARTVVRFAASTSVKMVIGTAIAQFVPTETKAQKAKLVVGTYVISGLVADAASNWAESEFNDYAEMLNILKQKFLDKDNEIETETPNE